MTPAIRSIAATLALSAMLLRAFLPAGWMPNTDGVPGTPLVICSVDGLHHVVPVRDPSHPSRPDIGVACPFAAAAHFASLREPPVLSGPAIVASFVPAVGRAAIYPDRHFLAREPRGPPASV